MLACIAPLVLLAQDLNRPSVGVVLSGGGAKGMAHIGFLQVLEEAGLPIDCIAGTSMGSSVAAHYAAGWSPAEMRALVEDPAFERQARGEAPWRFGFKQDVPSPEWVRLRLSAEEGVDRSNLVSGLPTDWMVFENLAPANAVAGANFDSLFVPFRCVAADIKTKSTHIFRSGSLATAVRASMSYPFYLPPVVEGGAIYLDGGLYNNFPSDVLYADFMPDIILGCNVATPDSGSFTGSPSDMVEWMVTRPTNYDPLCGAMIVVEPDLRGMDTFDFGDASSAVDWGAETTRAMLDSIVGLYVSLGGAGVGEELGLAERRQAFRAQAPNPRIGQMVMRGLDGQQERYVRRILNERTIAGSPDRLERMLYLLESDPHIAAVRPVAGFDDTTGLFDLDLFFDVERDLSFWAGGSLSSRPVSFGHAGIGYSRFGRVPFNLEMSSSFGNFYSGLQLKARFDRHGWIPFAIEPSFVLHRWNYVRSFATFFEDVRPSYLVLLEQHAGVTLRLPTGPTGLFSFSGHQFHTLDDHYPTLDFNPADTTDRTVFDGWVGELSWRRSDLDHPVFGRVGSHVELGLRQYDGSVATYERNPVSGRPQADTTVQDVAWTRFQVAWEQYLQAPGERWSLGVESSLLLSDEALRNNLRASQIAAVPFQPLAGANSRFLPRYRSYGHLSAGLIADVNAFRAVRSRLEAHWYRPFVRITEGPLGPVLDWDPGPGYQFGVYLLADTQAGMFSFGVEHYYGEEEPWNFEFSWGKRLFQPTVRW
jgi:NTE family protein